MRYAWIREHRGPYPLNALCRALGVSRSGYYAWTRRAPSPRHARREELVMQIREAHEGSRRTYGSPRVHADLRARRVEVCENTVARYMRQEGITARRPRRFRVVTTDARHPHPVAANTLDRRFAQPAPDRGWVADITYLPTAEGWLYLAVVIDLFSRRVVGHAAADHLRASLALDALDMALRRRSPARGDAGAGVSRGSTGAWTCRVSCRSSSTRAT